MYDLAYAVLMPLTYPLTCLFFFVSNRAPLPPPRQSGAGGVGGPPGRFAGASPHSGGATEHGGLRRGERLAEKSSETPANTNFHLFNMCYVPLLVLKGTYQYVFFWSRRVKHTLDGSQ